MVAERRTEMLAARALFETPGASNLRKAQVRAALFRKQEPIRIGRFILLEPLGAGAMGERYAAYDEQLDRKVALQLVTAGSGVDDRLLREAQTLAQVSHPNVVQIYQAGTDNGRLFIAMELVRGKTLSSWLEAAARMPRAVRQREILRKFIAAGRGLEAAHAAGVAHRDFTPDKVMVGDDGRVRVVDFGLACAPNERGNEPASESELGVPAALVPRPENDRSRVARVSERGMAPMRGALADLRNDQFSFCVGLSRALYDVHPSSGRRARGRTGSTETDGVELAPRGSGAAYVRRALHRGLAADPARRFASMGELLAALEPEGRRRRGRIAAAACLIMILLGAAMYARAQATVDPCGAAGTEIAASWSADRQVAIHAAFGRSDLPFAEAAWRGVKVRLDAYTGRWRGAAIAACQATHLAGTQSEQELDRRMLCLEHGRRQLAALAGELGTGVPEAVEHAIEATEALPEPDACRRAGDRLFGVAPPPPAAAAEVAAIRDRLARALTLERVDRDDESLAIAREASASAARLGYPPVHAEALVQMARALDARSTADTRAEAQRLYFEALQIAEAQRHDQLAVEIWKKLVMLAVRMDSGMAEAHAWWGQAYAWSQRNAQVRSGGEDAGDQAELHHMLGEIYYRESEYAKAADEERRAIAAISALPTHRLELIRYDDALAKSLEFLDDLDGAERLHERAVALATEMLGAGHPNVIKLEINYGKALEKTGHLDRARAVLEDALASMPARYRDSHPDAARIYSFLSDLDYREEQLDRAAEHGRKSLAIYERTQAPDHVRLAEAYTNLANALLKRRNFTNALAMYQDALALRHRHLGDGHYQIGVNEGSIAEALVELERFDEAMTHLVEAERIFKHGSGHERGTQAWMLTVRGEILAGKRQFDLAIPVLEQALALFGDTAADPTNHALALWTLARALHELERDRDRVRSLAERAYAIFAAHGVVDAHSRDRVARFLGQLAPKAPREPADRAGDTSGPAAMTPRSPTGDNHAQGESDVDDQRNQRDESCQLEAVLPRSRRQVRPSGHPSGLSAPHVGRLG